MRKAAAVLAAAIAVAIARPSAWAQIPPYIDVTGTSFAGGPPDPVNRGSELSVYTVPTAPGDVVQLDFTNCPDVRLCSVAVGGAAIGCTPAGGARTVTAMAAGPALSFRVLGAGVDIGPMGGIRTGTAGPCMAVRINGVLIGSSSVVVYDLNGAVPGQNGINGIDAAIAKSEVLAFGPNVTRLDYNHDGQVSGIDLSIQRQYVLDGAAGVGSLGGCSMPGGGAAGYCP